MPGAVSGTEMVTADALSHADQLFADLGLPIAWREPGAGTFAMAGPAPATVHVEAIAGSLLLVILVDERATPTARNAGGARLGPRDGDTAAVFTELALTPSLDAADVQAALAALVTAVRQRETPAAA
jgi:hypothetical protein